MTDKKQFLYGPVPSRRLGLSCGIDIVPFKICTLDCIYCQLGRTLTTTTERKEYIAIEPVLTELKEALVEGMYADFITIAGSGEPTLNSRLGELIDGIKKLTNIPIAILTNGTLLYREDVRADCSKADVVMPSLDAGDEDTFGRINHPNSNINIEKLVFGLFSFRKEFSGQIWLEVFLVQGMNTGAEEIARIKKAIELINPDKIHLNTAARPTAYPNVARLSTKTLQEIADLLGPNCEIVADSSLMHICTPHKSKSKDMFELHSVTDHNEESLLSMLKRRPCSIDDICSSLGISRDEASKYISDLLHRGIIHSVEKDGTLFLKHFY